MKGIYFLALVCLPFLGSCQKKQVFSIEKDDFNKQVLSNLETNGDVERNKILVLFKQSCNGGPFYFIFKYYSGSFPDHLEPYLTSNNKVLKVEDVMIPLITESDYQLYLNQGFGSDIVGYVDGTMLGKSNRFIIVLENNKGKFGRIIPQEELLDH